MPFGPRLEKHSSGDRSSFLALIVSALPLLAAHAQEPPEPAADETAAGQPSSATPRRAIDSFMRAVEASDYEAAVEYLDLRDLPPRYRNAAPTELVRQLGIVFTREVWLNPSDLSDQTEGATADDLPPDQDRLAVVEGDDGDLVLLLQRVEREGGGPAWKISNATVARTADLYADFGYGPIVEFVADKLPQVSILGVELFKWVLVLSGGLLVYAALYLGARLAVRFWMDRATLPRERLFKFLRGPAALVITVLAANAMLYELGLGVTARRIAEGRTLLILLGTWLALSTLNLLRDGLIVSLRQQRREAAVVIQRPMFAAIKIIVVVTAALTWLDNIGYNVTTLLASLGIGGIAVALALQRPLEDVFGAFTLYNQQPIRVGDFCRFGDKVGTVEDIGLRTTRFRTVANTMISVPNAKIAAEYLENFSARRRILYSPTLRLRYDTPPERLQRVLGDLREMLASHPRVLKDALRVRFVRIGADALEVDIFANLDTTAWPEYLELAEDINVRVLKVIAAAGASLALPAQSLVVERAAGAESGAA